MRRHSSSPSRSRKPVPLARAPTLLAITATCFTQSSDLFARAPKGGRKIGNLLRKQGDFHSETPNFSPNRATHSGVARLFLWNDSTSFTFPRLTFPPSPTRQAPSPIVHSSRPLLYVYLPSIRCPRRPLRHESRYRRRSPRRMGTINRDRRTTAAHRQRIARCAN